MRVERHAAPIGEADAVQRTGLLARENGSPLL